MRSGNPALKDSTFLDLGTGSVVSGAQDAMSLNGTVNKTAFLLVLTLAGALYTWSLFFGSNGTANLMPYVLVGGLGGFVVSLVTIFKKTWAPVTAPLYAALEGLFIGAISAMFEMKFPGIVMQAVGLTFGTLAALLMAYRSGLIKATENFKLGVVAATGGIAQFWDRDADAEYAKAGMEGFQRFLVQPEALEEILALGCSIALDDFGAGWSSLSQVHRLARHSEGEGVTQNCKNFLHFINRNHFFFKAVSTSFWRLNGFDHFCPVFTCSGL